MIQLYLKVHTYITFIRFHQKYFTNKFAIAAPELVFLSSISQFAKNSTKSRYNYFRLYKVTKLRHIDNYIVLYTFII